MAQLLYAQTNYFTTNLTTTNGIDATQTTGIILNDVSGLYDLSKPSIIALDWVKNTDGTLDTTNLEYIEVTSIDPSTKECQGVTRGVDGFAAKAHDFGAVIVFPISRSTINRLADGSVAGLKDVTTVDANGDIVFSGSVQARPKKRVYSTTSLATLTPEIDTYDIYRLTAQAEAITIANPSTSTPNNGDMILLEMTCDGTNRAVTLGTAYISKSGQTLTTLTASKLTTALFIYIADLSKWNLLSVATET